MCGMWWVFEEIEKYRGCWWDNMDKIDRLEYLDIHIWANFIKIDLNKQHGRELTEFIRLDTELGGSQL